MKATDPRTNRSSTAHPFATVELFGLPFLDAPDEATLTEHLLDLEPSVRNDSCLPIVVTPNVDIVVQLLRSNDSALQQALSRCAFVLPDGAPIVWTSRWAGDPLQARIAGSNLFREWWPRVAADRRRVVVLAPNEAVKAGLEAEHPDAEVMVAPMIDTSEAQIGAVADDLVNAARTARADACVICVGHPKDALVALAAVERWPADEPTPLFYCLGASAELYLGLKRRAPEWAQRHGLEWLVRFAQEPRRMFRRYFVRDLGFFPLAWREVTARRRR